MKRFVFLLFAVIVSSCNILPLFVERYDTFIFRNNSEYDLILLFDFVPTDFVVSKENLLMNRISNKTWCTIDINQNHSWDKYVKDSLHLYVLQNTYDLSVWQDKHIHSDAEFIERYITDDYIKEYLMARMTLKLEDIYPPTYPFKDILFPPDNDAYYNTLYYNYSIKPTE